MSIPGDPREFAFARGLERACAAGICRLLAHGQEAPPVPAEPEEDVGGVRENLFERSEPGRGRLLGNGPPDYFYAYRPAAYFVFYQIA